jgi:hypothetical protein
MGIAGPTRTVVSSSVGKLVPFTPSLGRLDGWGAASGDGDDDGREVGHGSLPLEAFYAEGAMDAASGGHE